MDERSSIRSKGYDSAEDKMARRIDNQRIAEAMAKIMDGEDQLAFQILAGERAPTPACSRKWATKRVTEFLHGHYVMMMTTQALTCDDLDMSRDLIDYFVPKAKQGIEVTGADDGPVKFQREPTYEEMLAAAMIADGAGQTTPPASLDSDEQ